MLKAQAEHLENQTFSGNDGAHYCILRLVLWAQANSKVTRISVSKLVSEFESSGNQSDEPDGSPEFVARAIASEDYPILVQKLRDNRLSVMDGRHRLFKAMMKGQKFIRACIIHEDEMPVSALYVLGDDTA